MIETSTDTCKKDKDHKWRVTNLTPFTRKCIICEKEEIYEEDNKTFRGQAD